MKTVLTSLRLVGATMFVCCVAYPLTLLVMAQLTFAESANGHLLRSADGTIVGSRQIAQRFEAPRYFWPRPSAVDYNGAGAGGSNKSPTNPALAERARALVERHSATDTRPLPADLVTASGSGLDPHISEEAVRFQVGRVAAARAIAVDRVQELIDHLAFAPGGPFAPARIVNVLELNLALDQLTLSP